MTKSNIRKVKGWAARFNSFVRYALNNKERIAEKIDSIPAYIKESSTPTDKKVVAKAIESMDKQVGGAVRRLSDSNSEWEEEFEGTFGRFMRAYPSMGDFMLREQIKFISDLLTSERDKQNKEWKIAVAHECEQSEITGRIEAFSEVLALIEGMNTQNRGGEFPLCDNNSCSAINAHNAVLSDLRTTIINKQKSA